MLSPKVFGVVLLLVIAFGLVNGSAALAQEQTAAPAGAATAATARSEPDYDVQLHLVVASNNAAEKSGMPQSLDGTIRQLRTTLPFAHYRLASTFLNRVKDGGSFDARGVGSFLITSSIGPNTPTFYDFAFFQLKLDRDARGQKLIRISKFRFSLRVPIVTGTTHNEAGNASFPVINYETVGMSTEIGIREATPTVIGTFATGRPDELVILLLSVKQAVPE